MNNKKTNVDISLELIQYAINNEVKYILTLEQLLQLAPTDEEKALLLNIYNDDKKHYKYFEEIRDNYLNQNPVKTQPIHKVDSYINSIKVIKLDKLNAVKIYRDIFARIYDNYYKQIMFDIITDELIHAEILDHILYLNSNVVLAGNSTASNKTTFTTKEASEIAKELGIDFSKELFDLEQYRMGLDVELEHGKRSPKTNVTNDDYILTGKIALAHLNEIPDYYTRLSKLEQEAKQFWKNKPKK